MYSIIYVEESVRNNPQTIGILKRYQNAVIVNCSHYGELFNRRKQNFRTQKQEPTLIIARKDNRRILPIPGEYAIDAKHNFYFSHMLNCLYDCRYCFLQGMFRSASHVIFVNYDDFKTDLLNCIEGTEDSVCFYSGYDCDSLALDPITDFTRNFIPIFKPYQHALLELRSKSTQIRNLLTMEPLPNIICAFSLSPQEIVNKYEDKTPSLNARLAAIRRLQDAGWNIALRFDPIILVDDFYNVYKHFFHHVYAALGCSHIHSITLGSFRLPKIFHKNMKRLYPDEPLLINGLNLIDGQISYAENLDKKMIAWCEKSLKNLDSATPIYIQKPKV
jgi:spore photoproduct lyase